MTSSKSPKRNERGITHDSKQMFDTSFLQEQNQKLPSLNRKHKITAGKSKSI